MTPWLKLFRRPRRPLRRRPSSRLQVEPLEDRRLLAASWQAVGPAPIYDLTGDGEVVSGRVTSIAVDPYNPATVYIGSAGGGVWENKNIDSSQPTWKALTDNVATQVNDPLLTLPVGALATAKSPYGVTLLYVGLGEANAVSTFMTPSQGASQFYGGGVLRGVVDHTTGTVSWKLLGGSGASNLFYRRAISKIIVDPTDPSGNSLYVAVATAKNGLTSNEGIWKYAKNGQGVYTWTNTTSRSGLPANVMYHDLILDPNDSTSRTLFAAIAEPVGNAANGLYKTTNGGGTWSKVTSFENLFPTYNGAAGPLTMGRITLAAAPRPSPTPGVKAPLYAAVMTTLAGPPPSGESEAELGSLYQLLYSNDDGVTWQGVGAAAGTSGGPFYLPSLSIDNNYVSSGEGLQGYYDTTLIVDPGSFSTVYAGGQDRFLKIPDANKSTFDQNKVIDLASGDHGPIHVDHHGIAFTSKDGKYTLLDGNDGGIFKMHDPSGTSPNWTNLNGTYDSGSNTAFGSLQIAQLYGVAINPANPAEFYGGAQDNGNFRYVPGKTATGSLAWQAVTKGDGGRVYIDPNNISTTYPFGTVYVTDTGNILSSAQGLDPTTGNPVMAPINPFGTLGAPPASGDPVSAFPVINGEVNGTKTNPFIVASGFPGNFPAPTYFMQVINGKDYLWYGGADAQGNSALWLSTDNGATSSWKLIGSPTLGTNGNGWFATTQSAPVNGFSYTNAVVDSIGTIAANPSVVYVGGRGGNLLVTTNGLDATPTWTQRGPLPLPASQTDLRYADIFVDPFDSTGNTAYVVAANFGEVTGGGHVWMTTNAGVNWRNISGNLPNVPVWSIQVQHVGAPTTPPVVYVGTDVGVFATANSGARWARYGAGLPNVQVRDMDLFASDQAGQSVLLVGTWGHGAYKIAPLSPQDVTGQFAIQPLSYRYNAAVGAIVGSFLILNKGAPRTGTFSLNFRALPPGVTVVGQSAVRLSLGTWQAAVVTVNFTPASARSLSLLLKARNATGQLLYPAQLLELPI